MLEMPGVTKDFWQYAITRPRGLWGLTFVRAYVYECAAVQMAN